MASSKTDTYVLLTGGINNAGDYLIGYRTKQLLAVLRPDRQTIEYASNETLDDQSIDVINRSKALILLGGPGIQPGMYPGVFALTRNLERIRVPIVMMGLGWKSAGAKWDDTHNYRLSENTIGLLNKICKNGTTSSVRDYHTLNVLFHYGFSNVIMTGCPAYYDLDYVDQHRTINPDIKSVSFSIGRMFVRSRAIRKGMISVLRKVKHECKNLDLTIVFHHSTDAHKLKQLYPDGDEYARKQSELLEWLRQNGFKCKDISGSVQGLIDHYSACDFHIGYRLHAHIFASSISKPSILIAEDGRGTGAHEVLGGYMFMAFRQYRWMLKQKLYKRIGFPSDPYKENHHLADDVAKWFRYELDHNYIRTKAVRSTIDRHFSQMTKFIASLP